MLQFYERVGSRRRVAVGRDDASCREVGVNWLHFLEAACGQARNTYATFAEIRHSLCCRSSVALLPALMIAFSEQSEIEINVA